jgi:hypothetical protein
MVLVELHVTFTLLGHIFMFFCPPADFDAAKPRAAPARRGGGGAALSG